MNISFYSNANKTNFHLKSFALSIAFIARFTASQQWPFKAWFAGLQGMVLLEKKNVTVGIEIAPSSKIKRIQ